MGLRCPYCGSTDVRTIIDTKGVVCNDCQFGGSQSQFIKTESLRKHKNVEVK